MQLQMQNAEELNLEQIGEFLKGSYGIEFSGQSRTEKYAWTEQVLIAREYGSLSKKKRGEVRGYIAKVTGLSLAQVTRLVRKYRATGKVEPSAAARRRFPRRYTAEDISLLAEVDRAHERLSGPATRCILKREYERFGKSEYARLAGISVAHLYNLRHSVGYRRQAAVFEPTRSSPVAIGQRRKPDPRGQPGYLRVDTVHQGDWDGAKGVYHINAIDAVLQWEVLGCASKISESHLIPVLEAILHQFPFPIRGFHADNGSEYINHAVARLLEKLLVEFTKSRASRTQDNALVEGKNGAVIRKYIGFGHIGGEHAERVHKFYAAYLNPYLNFHRPCGFATVTVDGKGKRRRQYRVQDYATPYEKLKALPNAAERLKPGISIAQLDRQATRLSDTQSASKMGLAKAKLLRECKVESPLPPRFA
ncbi:MAG: integrase [Acidobacteriota bacterium]|nr:integrase [Acidobacteriota bacterium]